MLEFNTGSADDKLILTDDVTTDIKLIFAIDESLKSTLDLIFPNHQLKHSLSVLSKLTLVSEELVKEHIVLYIHSNFRAISIKSFNSKY
jgi:hypothetical protein